ncbi:MAG: hypothetical protein QM774_14355 [Gordonia sp. (in: high G+C Gram-positive bacteria)]|uniref:DUF6882 domain-containing protein n=1 Tax=Gordonia sp. (in: high G+C Gram-positive bacteria) TaxID=84139 RepID=UPI0039E3349C
MTDDGLELSVTPGGDHVAELIDHVVVLSSEAQTAFLDRYQGRDWRVDLNDPAVFWFTGDVPAKFRPHYIGSTSSETNTWMWGWNNINGFPDDVVDAAQRVHAVGEQLGLIELTTARQSLDPAERVGEGLPARDRADYTFVLCAQAVAGLRVPVYYSAPSGTGRAWFLLDNEAEFTLAPPSALSVAQAVIQAVESGFATDHRLAVTAYAERRDGVTISSLTADRIVVAAGDGDVVIDFDAEGRCARIQST